MKVILADNTKTDAELLENLTKLFDVNMKINKKLVKLLQHL